MAQIPTEAQLAIIGRYANRVRCAMPGLKWSRPVRSFLQTLAYSSKNLMPNLRDLHVRHHKLHLIRPLLGPRLQHLYIFVSSRNYKPTLEFWHRISVHMILRSLPTTCPSLESFEFRLSCHFSSRRRHWNATLALPVSYAIQNLQKLRRVKAPVITNDALTHLGGLSSFTSIKTRLPTGSDLEDILDSSRDPILFKNFDSVDWKIKKWRDVEVFTRLWPHKLTSVSLRSQVGFDPSLLQEFFLSLHKREAFKNLQQIHLCDSCFDDPSIDMAITIDTIRPLFYLSHLRVVEIDTTSFFMIGEDDLEEIGGAWPNLEVLYLNMTNGYMCLQLRVSLPGIVRFVEKYPGLKKLCIGATISSVADDYELETASLYALEPRDSDSRLEFLMMRYPRDEGHIWSTYSSRLDILFTKLFPRLQPDTNVLHPDEY